MNHALFLEVTDLALLRAGIAILVALVGALVAVLVGGISHRTQCALISLAAGVLLGVGLVAILPETRELIGSVNALGALGGGVVLFVVIGRFLYFACPACTATASDREHGFMRLGWLLIAAGTLHAFSDGIALTIGAEVSEKVGLLVLGAVAVHKLPEGAALAALAMQAGYRRWRALWVTLAMELVTALGSGLGLLAGQVPQAAVGVALGIAGGTFLYVGAFALITEAKEHEKTSIALWAGIGFTVIAALGLLLPE